jgi:membrane-associated phospholipid phosphatase
MRRAGTNITFLLVLVFGFSSHAQTSQPGVPVPLLQETLPVAAAYVDTACAVQPKPRFSPAVKATGAVLASAALWTATYAWVDEPLQKFMQSHRTQPLDAVSRVVEPMGRQRLFLPATGTLALVGFVLRNPDLRKVGTVSFTSLLISGGVTGFIKNQVHRYRPSGTNENHFYDWGMEVSENTSFPSSHTTVAFAMATSVASVYGKEHVLVPPLAYGMATLVGLSRINDNAHWATDVMAGAALGFVSAKSSLWLYHLAERKISNRRRQFTLSPQVGVSSTAFTATVTF